MIYLRSLFTLLAVVLFMQVGRGSGFEQAAEKDLSPSDTLIHPSVTNTEGRVYLNAIHFRVLDLAQTCAGITYERYLVTRKPMSLVFSFSYPVLPFGVINFYPEYILAAGFRYQFMQYDENINLFVLPEIIYSERSVSFFSSYTSPGAYLSGGAQYKIRRLSCMASVGLGVAGTVFSYSPSARIQFNVGYAF